MSHQNDLVPDVINFLSVLLQHSNRNFSGIANLLYPSLLDYMNSSFCISLDECHRFVKQCIVTCSCSPRLVMELLRLVRTLDASSPLLPYFVEYLHLLCSYDPSNLQSIRKSLQLLLNETMHRARGNDLATVNQLNTMLSLMCTLSVDLKTRFKRNKI